MIKLRKTNAQELWSFEDGNSITVKESWYDPAMFVAKEETLARMKMY